jgi:hypothetical protein
LFAIIEGTDSRIDGSRNLNNPTNIPSWRTRHLQPIGRARLTQIRRKTPANQRGSGRRGHTVRDQVDRDHVDRNDERAAPRSRGWAGPGGAALIPATELPASHRQLEVAVREYTLDFPEERDPAVEKAAFPDMVGIYRRQTTGHIPPSQGTFADEVARQVRGYPRKAVFARACRTYPSFVRQHHAVLALREHFPVVVWDQWLDQLQGVDVLVVDERGLAAGIDLSTDTTMAHGWHAIKSERHGKPPIPVLEVFADPHEYRIGAFWLHDPDKLVAQVRETMEANLLRALHLLEQDLDDVYRRAERRPKCSRQDFEAGFRGALAFLKHRLLGTVP